MLKKTNRLIKKAALLWVLMTSSFCVFSQDAYMNLMDTAKGGLFGNFIGIKLFATDLAATSLNQKLQFHYQSNNIGAVYNFQHDMNVTGLTSFYNLGLGLEENLGKHLSINFFNTSLGYMQNMWDWNVGAGAGYFISLNKKQTMRLNVSMDIYFESITYSFGDDYDSTQLGFLVNGTNVGTAVKNVKYVNDIWSLTPGVEFLYRRPSFDFFVGVYYNYVFSYSEKVNFYKASEPVSSVIYYQSPYVPSNNIAGNAVNLGKYVIQIGIVREFGL
jgi:hypothetical protein